jgi:hypothetical protein
MYTLHNPKSLQCTDTHVHYRQVHVTSPNHCRYHSSVLPIGEEEGQVTMKTAVTMMLR